MRVTRDKNCYCHTCDRDFHYLGINRHRAAHRDRNQDCTITYTHGDTYVFAYSSRGKTRATTPAPAGNEPAEAATP